MTVVGVDLSTLFVDLVKLDEETDRAEWVRVPLTGENAIDRARSYRGQTEYITKRLADPPVGTAWMTHYPKVPSQWWDDVILCALEDPGGRGDTRKIARVQGVVIATIPARVQVWTLQPAEWRKACGLPGNCGKDAVQRWMEWRPAGRELFDAYRAAGSPNDVCDAYAIAYAARSINQTQELDQDC